MPVKLNKLDGSNDSGKNPTELIVLLAQQLTKKNLEGVAALTDNSGGDATPTAAKIQYVDAFVEVADAGTTSADVTNAAAILVTVKDAITELATKANAYAVLAGVTGLTDNSGGTGADGTIAAIDTTVTAATTGAQDTETNANRVLINNGFREIATVVNRLAVAAGQPKLVIDTELGSATGTIAAITTAVGSAASPAVTKAAFDAAVVKWQDNVAYLAATLNTLRTVAVGNVTVI